MLKRYEISIVIDDAVCVTSSILSTDLESALYGVSRIPLKTNEFFRGSSWYLSSDHGSPLDLDLDDVWVSETQPAEWTDVTKEAKTIWGELRKDKPC